MRLTLDGSTAIWLAWATSRKQCGSNMHAEPANYRAARDSSGRLFLVCEPCFRFKRSK